MTEKTTNTVSATPMDVQLPVHPETWHKPAYEKILEEKDQRILLLEARIAELTTHLSELRVLVQALEEKYEVRY